MTTQHTSSHNILILILCMLLFACSEDDPQPTAGGGNLVEEEGISPDEFDRYQGEIGFILNARDVAKKGYLPTQAVLQVDASNGDYSQTIDLDPISFMGQVKLAVEDLDEAARQELTSGVPVSVTLLDENNNQIIEGESLSSVSFLPNPQPQNVNAANLAETPEVATIHLRPGTNYFLQQVQADGTVVAKKLTDVGSGLVLEGDGNSFVGEQPLSTWRFEPVPGKQNTFYIRQASTNAPIVNSQPISIVDPINGPVVKSATQKGSKEAFRFEKVNDGVYRIRNSKGQLVNSAAWLTYSGAANDVYFRIIAKDISWTAQSIGTTLISPILPEAQTAFGYNSTLTNCGRGDLSQTVGTDFSEERTNTVGWDESVSLTASATQSISTTVDVGFNATFFGTGATYSQSVTYGLDLTVSHTSERSKHASQSVAQTETYFSSRTITVPSGRASLVYDAYQFYDNVRVEYVQRIRLSAIDENGNALSGEEIRSLMAFSRFNGVVNIVESESVVFTMKGNSVLDRFIETQSSVEDVPSACN